MESHTLLLAQTAKRLTTAAGNAVSEGNEIVNSILTSFEILRNVLTSAIILVVFYLIGKFISRRIIRALHEAKGDSLYPDMESLVNRFSVFGSLFVGFAIVVQFIFELDFLQVVGFFGLGVSFAFKDLLSNLVAGAVVIIQNRFRVGDFIQIGMGSGLKGKVMEIQTRATILKAIDGTEIIVPNAELLIKPVISFTAHHTRRISFTIDLDLDADLKKATKLAKEILSKKEHVLRKPTPEVIVGQVSGPTMKLKMQFWVDPQSKERSWILIKSELMTEIKEAFDREGILISYPMYSYLDRKRAIPQPNSASPQSSPAVS